MVHKSNQLTQKCIASGKVQGVGFRWSTKQKAKKLNITGHAKNLDDGTVEIIACGSKENVEKLKSWLKEKGPRLARIESFECKDINLEETPTTFRTM